MSATHGTQNSGQDSWFLFEAAVRDFGGLVLAGGNCGGMHSSEDHISRRKLHLDRRKRLPTKLVAE
jgi:hypothetical protein